MEAPSSVLIITANMITSNSKISMTFMAHCNVKLKCAVKMSTFGAKLLSGTSICFVEHTVKLIKPVATKPERLNVVSALFYFMPHIVRLTTRLAWQQQTKKSHVR